MKICSTIITALILILCHSLSAQSFHELGLNLSGIGKQQYKPSYEYIFDSQIGLNFIAGFDLRDEVISNNDSNNPMFQAFTASRLEPTFAGKFYISKKRKGQGFFLGPMLSLEILLNRDENYLDAWESNLTELANDPRFSVPTDQSKTSGLLTIVPGMNLGYKLLIKEHFIFEIFTFLSFRSENEDVELLKTSGFDYDLDFRIGYRF